MALFCIPKHLVETLKNSALKGEVDIAKLYEMSSKDRREFFTKHTDPELGKFINTKFEQAVVSKQKDAMLEWAKSVFTPEAQTKSPYKNIVDKINSLDELGVLNPETADAFLEDLVSDKLGINVTAEETKEIYERAKDIDAAQKTLGKDLGNPKKAEQNIAFFKAKKKMDDYLNSLMPANKVRVLSSTIGRGMMLASLKSPILNVGSNMELALSESIARRVGEGAIKTTDNKMATDYIKFINKVYQETGYDLSRMHNLADSGVSGGRVLGEKGHSQGKGKIRRLGRFFEDTVFKQMLGAPDVAFSSAHFADSANIGALKLAQGDKTKAKAIMEDAMRIEPQTAEGEILRAQAILDAETATWTNTTWASKASEGIRKVLNDVSGDARAGDFLLPFVKTPANVISTGIDYAGGGGVKLLVDTVKNFKSLKNGDLKYKQILKKNSRGLVRSGLGMTAAFILAAGLEDDDFMGAYDPARAQIEGLRNSTENSFRVGNKWVSTNWLGPLSVPFTAMMYAKKYGDNPAEASFQYSKGVFNQILEIPGVKDAAEAFKGNYKKDQTLDEMTGETKDWIAEQIFSRIVPSGLSDLAKGTDKYDRQTQGSTMGIPNVLLNKIPGIRQTLPKKKNIFGEDVTGESFTSDLLFGARVKTDKENDIIKEINTVSNNADKNINFTDWTKSSSKTLAQFKEKIGPEKYAQATIDYGQELKDQLETMFKSPKYKKLSDDEKAAAIAEQDSDAQEVIFKKYHFKYKQDRSKKKVDL